MDKRIIDLAVRKEDTKNKIQTPVIRFQLTEIKEHFSESIAAINEMCHIADSLVADGKMKQAENIWKSQYATVTMVSFDSVRDQLNLLGLDIQRVADDSFYDRSSREKTKDQLRGCLNELFSRRNIIAHQSGRRHEDAEPVELTKDEVTDYILKINKIITSINAQIEEK
jgi:hypothetical protein